MTHSSKRSALMGLARSSRMLRGIAAGLILSLAGAGAVAQEAAYNPKPGREDIVLPMPGDYKLVFVAVPVPGKGRIGGPERIFEVGGDRNAGEPFEFPRAVRIGGQSRRPSGEWFLAFGKYEVTIGQFAAVMGGGDLAKGVEYLRASSGIEAVKGSGAETNRSVMARPVHAITLEDHQRFINLYNDWCLKTQPCIEAMRAALGGSIGFVRLPTEQEWEFVARGGQAGAQSRAALPFGAPEVGEFAFINSATRNAPDQIGLKKPLPQLPVYDMFGNVSELMASPFTLDNGTGMVGGAVARGGDWRTSPQNLRVTLRAEIPHFFFRSESKVYERLRPREVGMRLMLGTLVRDPENRNVDAEIKSEFNSYIALGGSGGGGSADLAGNTLRTARQLGSLEPKKLIELSDTVGGDDPADFFSFTVPEFGLLKLEVASLAGDVSFEYKHVSQEASRTVAVAAGRRGEQNLDGTIPGQVWVKVFSTKGADVVRYAIKVSFETRDRAGNTFKEAEDLGVLDGKNINLVEYVGPGDPVDVYKFTTNRPDTISVRLLDLAADAKVELYDASEKKLAESIEQRGRPQQIEFKNAPPGVKFLRVYSNDKQPTTYKLLLTLGILDTAGDNAATARDLGAISNDQVAIEEHVSDGDRSDWFKVQITTLSRMKVQLSRMTADIDLHVHNSASREIASSRRPNQEAENLDLGLQPGVYYVEARNDSRNTTPYYLTIDVRPIQQYSHWDVPYPMTIGPTKTTFDSTVSDEAPQRFARFEMKSSGIVRVSLEMFRTDPKTDVDLFLHKLGKDGRLVAKSDKGGNAAELIAASLDPGVYLVRMDRHTGKTADIRMTLEMSTEAVEPSLPGQLLSNHDDWQVRTWTRNDGKRMCMAATFATEVSPSGWRAQRPTLNLWITAGERTLGHSFDFTEPYNVSRGFTATVTARGGSPLRIPILPGGGDGNPELRSLERCNQNPSEMCVSNTGLRGLTRGSEMELRATSKEGRDTVVRYSLRGYQAAVRAMNQACNNSGLTGWLIK